MRLIALIDGHSPDFTAWYAVARATPIARAASGTSSCGLFLDPGDGLFQPVVRGVVCGHVAEYRTIPYGVAMTNNGGDDAARPRRNSPPSRRRPAGDVAGVSVDRPPDDPRPVTVEVAGRRCRYELAWTVIDGRPAVTDLRVVARDGEPVSQTDLRVNLARIAAVVASRDTPHAREVWAGVAQAFADAAERSGLPRTGFEWWASYRPDWREVDQAVRRPAPLRRTAPLPSAAPAGPTWLMSITRLWPRWRSF